MPAVIPYVPEQITVHLGPPNADAANVTLPFTDYVKNVASSEIYPTWDESALRANILAIVSFALNRVYTEYYRSRGYSFDITNSTAYDQAFVNGAIPLKILTPLWTICLTATFAAKVCRTPGAKFCNVTTVTCEGLSQWARKIWAVQAIILCKFCGHITGKTLKLSPTLPFRGWFSLIPGLRFGGAAPAPTCWSFRHP